MLTAVRLACVVALAGVLLGSVAIPSASADAPESCSGTRTPATFRACIATAARVYTALWAPTLAQHAASATPPVIDIFTGPPLNPCVDATEGDVAVASFWCDKNRTVYVSSFASPFWTREYAREARRRHVLASDARRTHRTQHRLLRGFANQGAATELAHELGHWVQHQAGAYQSAAELAADCMAGWVQGRAAASGAWRNSPFIRWANHATIAELGGDLTGMRPHFRFPHESSVIAHGGPYSRLRLYDEGFALGATTGDGLSGCAVAAASYTGTQVPPLP